MTPRGCAGTSGVLMDKQRLAAAIDRFSSSTLLVVGDIMLDQFVWGEVSRISPEAPVPVVEVQKETMLLGGAANVANNLTALGSRVVLCGAIGHDSMGGMLRELASARGIDTSATVEAGRPTTVKTRIVARGQQMVRVDRESRGSLDEKSTRSMLARLDRHVPEVDGVIISDYAKGVVNRIVMEAVMKSVRKAGLLVLVDPKPVSAELYNGVTMLTPNQREAELMSGMEIRDEESLGNAAKRIQVRHEADAVLITRGGHGMALWQRGEGLYTIPTMAREVFDVTGAGDTVLAVTALGMMNGLSYSESAFLANMAAGVVVGKIGTATLSVDELKGHLAAR